MAETKGDRAIYLSGISLTDKDIYEAMKSIPGYLDITPGDFKELYCVAFKHAVERFTHSVLARDIMVRDVICVRPDTSLVEVAEIMGSRGISGVPVLDSSDRVVGVISEKDFLARMGPEGPRNFMTVVAGCLRAKGCVALPIRARTAADIMTTPPVTIHDGMPLVEIAEIFAEKSINRVPVTEAEGRILGMITRNDIIAATLRSRTCSLNTSAK